MQALGSFEFGGCQDSRASVIVKFDLSSAEPGDDAPAAIQGKFFKLIGRHRFQSRELGWMSDETFWFGREDARDFIFDCDKVWVHR